MDSLMITPVLLVLVIMALLILVWAVPVRLWVEAVFAGVKVGIGDLIGMRLRKVSPTGVVRPLIAATKAGLTLTTRQLEAHFLAGGHVDRVVAHAHAGDRP